jgi:hypothetical protein
MIFFLKLVAAAVVAILLIIGVVILLVWFKLRRLESFAGMAELPPFRRKLHACTELDWGNEDAAEALHEELLAEGFESVGDFEEAAPGFHIRGYVNSEKRACAMLIEDDYEIGVELSRDYEDNSRISVSGLPATLVSTASGARIIHKPEASVAELAKLLLLEAPVLDLAELPADAQAFASRYETVYAKRMNMVIDRGGPSIGEIRSHAIAHDDTCNEAEAERIRSIWLRHISAFFSQKQISRYRQLTGESDEHDYMLVAIHDRMEAEDLLAAVDAYSDFYYALDEADDDMREQLEKQNQAVAMIREQMQDKTPRQAFPEYLAANGLEKAYRFIQEVDKPIPGDIWRRSEMATDDYDEDLDDFTRE